MSIDLEEQYDKIYRYCYFKLHSRELAEDVTQETFLRYVEHYNGINKAATLKYLYTIARNICVDEYRKPKMEALDESILGDTISDNAILGDTLEEKMMVNLTVRAALSKLDDFEQELLLLRYVNDVSVSALGKIYGLSRFAIYRKIKSASNRFREELRKEDYHE